MTTADERERGGAQHSGAQHGDTQHSGTQHGRTADASSRVLPGTGEAVERESPRERVNRQWHEILQETRVAQTGVQILFGFLLSVAFTARFDDLGEFDRTVYVVTVILGAGATGALIAPVSIHRFLSGQRMKDEVVVVAGRLMMCGMVLLALTVGSTLLLILHVVIPGLLAEVLVGLVMLWFVCCWYVLPVWLRNRAERKGGAPQGG
ncbi:hypothetical protein GCM10012287_44050 [Streptomyces daqingensis]|uniref:Integral membrane protein n=1 Tax=Streptomyces daqingensis TaxID=1472640 RepID=A0ABQ2MMR1_9ACTN|nr:hypothetical protein GCM10012287_44050 [Streptomyces daqingensis]